MQKAYLNAKNNNILNISGFHKESNLIDNLKILNERHINEEIDNFILSNKNTFNELINKFKSFIFEIQTQVNILK